MGHLCRVHNPWIHQRRHPSFPLLDVDARLLVGLVQLVQVGGVVGGAVDEQVGGTPIEEPGTRQPRDETGLRGRRWPGGGGGGGPRRRGSGRGGRGGGWGGYRGRREVVSGRGGRLEVEHAGGFAVVDEVDVWPKEVEVVAVRRDVPKARHVDVGARGQADVVDWGVGEWDGRRGLGGGAGGGGGCSGGGRCRV